MGENTVSMDSLQNALKTLRELRSSVSEVFEKLTDGVKETEDPQNRDMTFLNELQKSLLRVNKDLGDLEKVTSGFPSQGVSMAMTNSSLLSLDTSNDRTHLPTQLVQAYRWSSKVQDYATYAATLLNQNSLKRSSTSVMLQAKKRKMASNTHAITQPVDNFLQTLLRFFPDLNISLSRPIGAPAVLHTTLGRTLKAIMIMRGLIVERVVIKSFDEDFQTSNGQLDIWSQSKYQVFQKVTDHTNSAMLHFYSPFYPELAIKSFLTWFKSYSSLFSAQCHRCSKHLLDGLPPTWRDLRNAHAYHEQCRN